MIGARRTLIAAVVAAVVTAGVFLPSVSNGWVNWDDEWNFLDNEQYRGLGPRQLAWMFTTFHLGPYQPLSWLTLALDYTAWGMAAWGYHFTNVLLHSLNAALLVCVVARLMRLAAPSAAPDDAQAGHRADAFSPALFAGIVALLWSLHPLRVESVSWVTERRDVLCGMFTLLTLLLHLRGAAAWKVALAAAGAMLSKGTAMVLPVLLTLIDLYALRPATVPDLVRGVGRAVRRHGAVMVLAVATAAAAFAGQSQQARLLSVADLSVLDRLTLFFHGLGFYAAKTVWPVALRPVYEPPVDLSRSVPAGALSDYRLPAALTAFALAALLTAGWRRRNTWPALLPLICAYVVMLAPVGGLVQAGRQVAADRYSYQPGWALTLLAALTARECAGLAAGRIAPRGVRTGCCVVVLLLGTCCVRQQRIWRDSASLWTHQLACDPTSAVGHFNLGMSYLQSAGPDADHDAEAHFQAAVAKFPQYDLALGHLGDVLRRLGRLEEAAECYSRVLALSPDDAPSLFALGCVEWRLGHADRAIAQFRALVRLQPQEPYARSILARALAASGDARGAIAVYEDGLKNCSDYDAMMAELARLLATHPDPAIRDGRRAMELADAIRRKASPSMQQTLIETSALAYAAAGQFATALQELARLNRADRNLPDETIVGIRRAFEAGQPWVVQPAFEPP